LRFLKLFYTPKTVFQASFTQANFFCQANLNIIMEPEPKRAKVWTKIKMNWGWVRHFRRKGLRRSHVARPLPDNRKKTNLLTALMQREYTGRIRNHAKRPLVQQVNERDLTDVELEAEMVHFRNKYNGDLEDLEWISWYTKGNGVYYDVA
jgi:hypothetical protein